MACENFLWGAPRIHGELLMLGFSLSQATVSHYPPAPSRRPRQSWRTFLRNQTIAFSHHQNPEQHSDTEYLGEWVCTYWGRLMRSVAQIARLSTGLCRWPAHQTFTPIAPRIALPSGSARTRRYAPCPSVGGGVWPLMESARQSPSNRRSDAKSAV
jgi:hypothetical protein